MKMTVKENLTFIQKNINDICKIKGRDASLVQLIAVTKYVGLETTKAALDAGINHIGENRVEGLLEKRAAISKNGTWHYIGSLQTRKVRDVIEKIDYLHSLDRLSLAKEVDKRVESGHVLKCFVQVNVSGEESKSGLAPAEVIPFIKDLLDYKKIQIVGLMTMAPFYDDPERTRPIFNSLRHLRDEVQSLHLSHAPCQELSMGMSNDYLIAVEEGATFVRIGSALVGRE